MKTKLFFATLVLLALIFAIVSGCFISDSALPLIILPFINFSLPECPQANPIHFFFPKEVGKEETKEETKKGHSESDKDNTIN